MMIFADPLQLLCLFAIAVLIYGLYICFCYFPWNVINDVLDINTQIRNPESPRMFNFALNYRLDPRKFRHRDKVEIPDPYGRVYAVNQDIKSEQVDNDDKEMNEALTL